MNPSIQLNISPSHKKLNNCTRCTLTVSNQATHEYKPEASPPEAARSVGMETTQRGGEKSLKEGRMEMEEAGKE